MAKKKSVKKTASPKKKLSVKKTATKKVYKIPKQVTVFARTQHKSQEWIKEMRKDLKWMSGDNIYHLLRAVLHALRDQLSIHEAAHFSAQLPLLLRGTFYESWDPKTKLNTGESKDDFIQTVKKNLSPMSIPKFDLEQGIIVALNVIKNHISKGEMKDLTGMLNPSLKAFIETDLHQQYRPM